MPRMNGLDMVKTIKTTNPTIPVLFFSAYNNENYFLEAITIGVDGYLIKPINTQQFKQSLYKCIHNIQIQKEHKEYQEQLKDQLIQKDKLLLEQSKYATMGEMIDIIAHQWKQPLNSIVMHASIIESSLNTTTQEVLHDEFRECYDNLNIQIETLLTTLNEFRTFLRPNDITEYIDLNKIINSSLVLLKDELISHQITIKIKSETDLPIKVFPNDIKQLLINIITNAKEEMIRTNLDSRSRDIEIISYKENGKTILKIKNRGDGIEDSILEDIFKMNFTTKEKSGGTGIGLYLCSLICKKYNAEIRAYNDNGATFQITF